MKKVLLQAFDEDTLPTFLGGTVDFDAVRESFTAKVDRTLADLCQQESSRQMAKVWRRHRGCALGPPCYAMLCYAMLC